MSVAPSLTLVVNMGRKLNKKPENNLPAENAEKRPPDQQIKAEIERVIGSLVNQGQREQIVARVTKVVESREAFSGPIAHPRHLREYDDILPGSADRIVCMAEKAQEHNQAMEKKLVDGNIQTSQHAMYLGFVVLIFLIIGAVYAGMNGNNTLAGLLLGTSVIGGAATLIRGYANNSNGKSEK